MQHGTHLWKGTEYRGTHQLEALLLTGGNQARLPRRDDTLMWVTEDFDWRSSGRLFSALQDLPRWLCLSSGPQGLSTYKSHWPWRLRGWEGAHLLSTPVPPPRLSSSPFHPHEGAGILDFLVSETRCYVRYYLWLIQASVHTQLFSSSHWHSVSEFSVITSICFLWRRVNLLLECDDGFASIGILM